jgi:hypothetical protein
VTLLDQVTERLFVLRGQLVHGASLLGWWLARQAVPELDAKLTGEQLAGLLVAHNQEQEEQVAARVLGMDHAQIQSLVMCEWFHDGGNLPGHVQALVKAAYRLGLKSSGSNSTT